MLSRVADSLLSLIYPQECSVCHGAVEDRSNGVACRQCWDATRIFGGTEMLCGKCGAYFGEKQTSVEVFCAKCGEHSYDRAFALGIYEKALAASIISLKTAPYIPARILGLLQKHSADLEVVDSIIPIPLSKKRKLERGFNQAEIVAGSVSQITGKPVDSGSLERHLDTHIHRMGMDQKARELSVRNAFSVKRPKLIDGRNIVLVDDVLTSGATASYCARVLKKHGAATVLVFTLARAVMH